jgi:plasmid stabilization system protein ParE
MARLVVAGPALLDAREIRATLSQVAGRRVARKYGANLKAKYRDIAQFPAAGAPRPTLGPHTRIRVVSPFAAIQTTPMTSRPSCALSTPLRYST